MEVNMERERAIEILTAFSSKIPSEKVPALRAALKRAPDSAWSDVFSVKTYSVTTTVLLSVFLGGLGIDRFYIGDVGLGIAKLLLGWLTLGIWPLIDIFVSYRKARIKSFNNIMSVL